MEKEVERYHRLGIISPADLGHCPYTSAIVVVPKKDGTFRMRVYYRRLNQQTVKENYNLPRIDEISLENVQLWTTAQIVVPIPVLQEEVSEGRQRLLSEYRETHADSATSQVTGRTIVPTG